MNFVLRFAYVLQEDDKNGIKYSIFNKIKNKNLVGIGW